jgi:hypothetical protein
MSGMGQQISDANGGLAIQAGDEIKIPQLILNNNQA